MTNIIYINLLIYIFLVFPLLHDICLDCEERSTSKSQWFYNVCWDPCSKRRKIFRCYYGFNKFECNCSLLLACKITNGITLDNPRQECRNLGFLQRNSRKLHSNLFKPDCRIKLFVIVNLVAIWTENFVIWKKIIFLNSLLLSLCVSFTVGPLY